jgi:F-type H+-transporting ATPase subunit gamma
MGNLREIRRRIAGVRSTSKITQAMKMVASAKLRRAQEAIIAARPYANAMASLIRHLMPRVDHDALPILASRSEVRNVLLIVVMGDRGLCGAFNSNIIKQVQQLIDEKYSGLKKEESIKLVCIGKKSSQHFGKRHMRIVSNQPSLLSDLQFTKVSDLADSIVAGYLSNDYDRVDIVYNEFKSIIQQTIRVEQMLPVISDPDPMVTVGDKQYHQSTDYIYEPSESCLLETLIPRHLAFQLWRAVLESNAAEQGARRSAMDTATSNANDLIELLQLEYNSARQSSITTEILEVVSGANALQQ